MMVYGKFNNDRAVARAMVSVCSISPFYPKAINVIAKMSEAAGVVWLEKVNELLRQLTRSYHRPSSLRAPVGVQLPVSLHSDA
jgi:hypothetical protein